MTPGRAKLPSLSAALAGIPAGVQPRGPWMGRRQLFVRFADAAETATLYTAEALRGELERLAARSRYHSIAVAGADPLAESEFLAVAFRESPGLPVLLEHDGQRPEALQPLLRALALVQVTMRGDEGAAALDRVDDSIARAAKEKVRQAVAICPADGATDAGLLRIVERIHTANPSTAVVLHLTAAQAGAVDRRWLLWLEQAAAVHDDVRMLPVAGWRM